MKIAEYSFEGPFPSVNYVERAPGVYLILDHIGGLYSPQYRLLHFGTSEDVRKTIEADNGYRTWAAECRGALAVAVLYTAAPEAVAVEGFVRENYLRALPSPASPR